MTQHIGIYRVERPIGRGGMGEVFLAWDDRLERRVAVKRIRRDAGLSPEQRERFRREARLAARLSHSAVVQIYDLATEDGDDAIVMEYVEGRTLAERLADGPLALAEALRLAQEIAQGLAAAHEAGLIHRDLKAANVIVTPAGHAKILDFGLARPTAHSTEEETVTRQGFVVGTFHTMSPEQARGEELDERSDLFSFGTLLYEMLTGLSPFRAADSFESLRRVVQEPAPDPRSLRPELPVEIVALLDRLLAKSRNGRPGSAREVIAALERVPAATVGSGALSGTVSDLPTAVAPRWQEPAAVVHAQQPPPSTLMGHSVRGRRRTAVLVSVAVVLCAVLSMAVWSRRTAPSLRVVVARPEISPASGDEELALAASGVLTATLSSLSSLQGVTPVEPRDASQGGTSPMAMARSAAAAETLAATVEREGTLGRVTLRRIRGSDGGVLWTEVFKVPIEPASLRLLADATAVRVLQHAYRDHRVRPGTPELDVRDQDYLAFLVVRQRVASGQTSLDTEIARLEEIVRDSPGFLDAQILAARFSLSLFESTRDPAHLDRATRLVQQARNLAPDDPRPLLLECRIALVAHREQEAEEILARIDQVLPGDPDALPLRARLAEQQGRPEEALATQRLAVEQVPSWQNLLRLAKIEARLGHIGEARERIATILRQAPGNLWAQEELGQIELIYGDLGRAEQIYTRLTTVAPFRAHSNLGMARFLSGRYEEAAEAHRRALAIEPDNPNSLLNLADTEMELGHRSKAEALYRRVSALYAETPENVRRGPRDRLIEAQCLARLRQTRQAVQIAQEALGRLPDDPTLLQQSALVHSLAGNRSSALNNAQAALENGLQPHWFSGSAFRSLREDPELRPSLQP